MEHTLSNSSGGKKGIPRPVLIFIGKGLLLFVVWKLLYLLWLEPKRVLDDPLTTGVGVVTVHSLNLFSGSTHYAAEKVPDTASADMGGRIVKAMLIYRNGQTTLKIADPCNGLELMVLYVGFLLCFPGTVKRKAGFMAAGLALIGVLNIIRCMLLVLIFVYYRKYLDFSHHFVFTIVVYAVIFWLWYLFTRVRNGQTPSGQLSLEPGK